MNGRNHAAIAGAIFAVMLPALGAGEARAAPPPSAAPSWEGFYVGGDVGYGFGVDGLDVNTFNFTGSATTINTDFLGGQGFIGGVLGGYNHMLTPRWLVGIEGDASWSNISHTDTLNDGVGDVISQQIAQQQVYSLRARVGYLLAPETLLYGTAGGAWSHFTYSLNYPTGGYSESDTQWLGGVQVGAGVETIFARGWSARLEYLQTFYNAGTFNPALLAALVGPIEVRPTTGVGRVAVIYRFGPDKAAPWTSPPARPSWNGPYVGGALGAGVADAKVDFPQLPGTSIGGVGIAGAFPTLMVGYNWRAAARWVVGAEGEAAPGISTADFQVDWTEAVRGRVGYLLTPATLLYGSVGWLTTGISTSSLVGNAVTVPSQRVDALEVGGGVETAFTEHWAARFDYQYAVPGALDAVAVNINTFSGPVVVHAQMHYARLGVVYMFDGR
jgi:outer membrane immunogenic protein